MEFIPYLALLHMLGALVGAGYSTFAEIFYLHAAEDGFIDRHEQKYLRRLFRGLHLGMWLVLVSGLALIVVEYLIPNAQEAVVTGPFWALETITLVIVGFGYLLSKRGAPWWLASASILAGWWMLLIIDLGVFNSIGYIPILMTYLLGTLVVAGVFGYLRLWFWKIPNPHDKAE